MLFYINNLNKNIKSLDRRTLSYSNQAGNERKTPNSQATFCLLVTLCCREAVCPSLASQNYPCVLFASRGWSVTVIAVG